MDRSFPLATMELANIAAMRRENHLFCYDFLMTAQELTDHGFLEGNEICVTKIQPKADRYTLGNKPMIKFLEQY